MCSKDLTHLHQNLEMWKTTKNLEEGSIEYLPYGSYCQLHCTHSAQTSNSGCGGFGEAQSFLSKEKHKAGRLTHGHDSAPVFVQQGFLRSSLQMTEGGDSPPLHTDTSSSIK